MEYEANNQRTGINMDVSTWSTQGLLTFLDHYEETAWELDESSLAGMEQQKEAVEAEIGARRARGEEI